MVPALASVNAERSAISDTLESVDQTVLTMIDNEVADCHER